MKRLSHGVRWNPDTDCFELRCGDCHARGNVVSYWPLDDEFWNKSRGMARCRACHMERDRLAHRRMRRNPEKREKDREYVRQWRRDNPTYNAEYARTYKRLHPDQIRENNRRYHEEHREERNAQLRERRAARKAAA